jgi:cytochrome c
MDRRSSQAVFTMRHSPASSATRSLRGATFALLAGVFTAGWSPEAYADTARLQTLMQRNNCTACHLIDKRKYGPNFNEVAARYAGNAGAVAMLAAKIRAGGSGVWGEDVMPPQPNVSEADARTMAELMLALKP